MNNCCGKCIGLSKMEHGPARITGCSNPQCQCHTTKYRGKYPLSFITKRKEDTELVEMEISVSKVK